MKSSLGIRRVRIVERPYYVLVTDPTPGKECTPSASYGLGQIPDKGRSHHSAAKTANRGMSETPSTVNEEANQKARNEIQTRCGDTST